MPGIQKESPARKPGSQAPAAHWHIPLSRIQDAASPKPPLCPDFGIPKSDISIVVPRRCPNGRVPTAAEASRPASGTWPGFSIPNILDWHTLRNTGSTDRTTRRGGRKGMTQREENLLRRAILGDALRRSALRYPDKPADVRHPAAPKGRRSAADPRTKRQAETQPCPRRDRPGGLAQDVETPGA